MKLKLEHLTPFLLDKVELYWFNTECELVGINTEEPLDRYLKVKFPAPNEKVQYMDVKIEEVKIKSINIYELIAISEVFSCPISRIRGSEIKDNRLSKIRSLLALRLYEKGLKHHEIGLVMNKDRSTVSYSLKRGNSLLVSNDEFKKMKEIYDEYKKY